MPTWTNIAGYKFTPLDNLPAMRERLLHLCRENGLKGTILLSAEGINLCVSGAAGQVEMLLAELRTHPGLDDLAVKESASAEQPFNRMLVKIKKEIIAFGVDGIDPARRPAPKLSARRLEQWLDEGHPVTLLDARNDYEVRMGTFRNAVPAGIGQFRDFPEAVRRLPTEWKDRPLVMFCTGGIRCEKAGPYMEREGFQKVFQLDGGILKYFEECGGAHYEGECFVFDRRVGVDRELRETHSVMCFKCQMPLTKEEQRDPHYVPDKTCPHCCGHEAPAAAPSP
ncbi:MAG: rhodanese-like domain-containing protein [Verrucomicrobiota bacterium]|nr:rhodanese-like domain-containing protein [Verrucomicrobiota bacterium]